MTPEPSVAEPSAAEPAPRAEHTGPGATGAVLTGLVLAAGAGTRFGGPKALARPVDASPWLHSAVAALQAGGVPEVTVVLGAAAGEASALVPAAPGVSTIVAADWAEGVGASLRAGIRHLIATSAASAAVVTLVDLPGLPAEAVARLVGGTATGTDAGALPAASARTLRQAVYGGRPGHPVVVGRDRWEAFAAALHGDSGGRSWLVAHGVDEVECGDLWSGRDVDVR